MTAIYTLYAFLWGAIWGSFLNVVIYRLPRDMNLARPESSCPACKASIRWYDNIPILSWILLRGRCRDCGTHIPIRYPFVELLVAVLSVMIWLEVSGGARGAEPVQVQLIPFLMLFFFMLVVVAIAFIDLDLTIIPHSLTFPTMALGLLAALLVPKDGVWVAWHLTVDPVDALVGLIFGGGVIWAVFKGYMLLTGRVGIGGGDFTMMAMIGANLGWQSLLFVLLFGSLQGLAFALFAAFLEKRRAARGESGDGFLLRGLHRPEFWDSDDADASSGAPPGTAPPSATGEVPQGGDPSSADSGSQPEQGAEPAAAAGDAGADGADGADGAGDAGADGADGAEQEGHEDDEDEDFLRMAIPFGPFLGLAALQYIFLGGWFLRWMGGGLL